MFSVYRVNSESKKMKLSEIGYLRNVVDAETSVSVIQDHVTYVMGRGFWEVCVEAPDGHIYNLNKQIWNAVDLVDFAARYPLDDPNFTLMFIYNDPDDFETVCFVPQEVMVTFGSDIDGYELEFKVKGNGE